MSVVAYPNIRRSYEDRLEPVQSKLFDTTEGGTLLSRDTREKTLYELTLFHPILTYVEAKNLLGFHKFNRNNTIAILIRNDTYHCTFIKEPIVVKKNAVWFEATVSFYAGEY